MPLELNPTATRPREETEPLVDRRQTNPMFNDQRMKLGLFGTNCSARPHDDPRTHDVQDHLGAHQREIAQRGRTNLASRHSSDRKMARFRRTTELQRQPLRDIHLGSRPGRGHQQHRHLRDVPPAHRAPDRDREGRRHDRPHLRRTVARSPNLVMGWFSPEMDMFHGAQREHDQRYAFGQQWLDLVLKAVERTGFVQLRRGVFLWREPRGIPEAVPGAPAQ